MFDTTQPGASGSAAQAPNASVTVNTGAIRKMSLSAPSGMTISLIRNFPASAKSCSVPNGPTTFGPLRICTPAQILRSDQSTTTTESRTPTATATTCRRVSTVQPAGVDQNGIPYSAAIFEARAAATLAEHSAMVTLARAIGLVK